MNRNCCGTVLVFRPALVARGADVSIVAFAFIGRVDAVVLSGGLGENSVELRETLLKQLQNTPLALSADAGSTVGASERETIKDLSRDAESARFSAPVGTNGVTWLICQVRRPR